MAPSTAVLGRVIFFILCFQTITLSPNLPLEASDKAAYLTNFGIAPHFLPLLLSKVKSVRDYVLPFDESLNRPLQSKHLDVHIRFWDGDCVSTRFFDSHSLVHVSADDLHK